MNSQTAITVTESVLPMLIGGVFILLAFFGIGELLKEAKMALKKEAKI